MLLAKSSGPLLTSIIVESEAGFNQTIYGYFAAAMVGSVKLNAVWTAYHGERSFVNRINQFAKLMRGLAP